MFFCCHVAALHFACALSGSRRSAIFKIEGVDESSLANDDMKQQLLEEILTMCELRFGHARQTQLHDHRHLPRHGRAGRLEYGAPGLLGAAGRSCKVALRSLRRVYPRAGAAVGGHAGPVQPADQGQCLRGRESVSVTDLLADSLALTGSATLDGLTAQGNVGCDQLLRNDVNCTDVFTTGVDASGAISCAALTATGTVAGATLSSTGAVSGSSLSITGAASVGLLSSATGITGSTLTINTANAGTSPRWATCPRAR